MSTETVNQQSPGGDLTVDPVHSTIDFAITHNGVATFRSGFRAYEATLSGGEQPQLEGTVEVATIDIDEEMLKGHLLSPEFFDAERHPRLKFHLHRVRGRRRRRAAARAASSRSAARPARSRPSAASPSSAPISPARPRRALDRGQRRPARASGSTGRPSCRAAARSSTTRSTIAVELELVARRPSSDAGPRASSGSLRRDSLNSALLRAAAERLPAGAELVEFERLGRDPALRRRPRRRGVAGRGRGAARGDPRRRRGPDRHPGVQPLDPRACSRTRSTGPPARPAQSALSGTPAAVIGASTGMFGAVWAQAETRKVLGALGGRVVEAELPVARADQLLVDGRLELARSSPSSSTSCSPSFAGAEPRNLPASWSQPEVHRRVRARCFPEATSNHLAGLGDAVRAQAVRRAAGRRRRSPRSGRRRRRSRAGGRPRGSRRSPGWGWGAGSRRRRRRPCRGGRRRRRAACRPTPISDQSSGKAATATQPSDR